MKRYFTESGIYVYHRPGPGPRVVLVHGSLDEARSFLPSIDELPPNWDLLAYDRRGYGKTQGQAHGSCAESAADLREVLGNKPAHIVGHSFGALISLVFAQKMPDQALSVTCYEPPQCWGDPRDPDVGCVGNPKDEDTFRSLLFSTSATNEDVVQFFMPIMIGETAWALMQNRTKQRLFDYRMSLAADVLSGLTMTVVGTNDLESIPCPVHVGYGSKNLPVWARRASDLRRRTKAGTLSAVEAETHSLHLVAPDQFASFIHTAVSWNQ